MAMDIAIVGAGIAGVATAHELAGDGHRVTVFERHATVAEEASFADPGLVAPALLVPWARPDASPKALAALLRRHDRPTLAWPPGWAELAWLSAWRRQAVPAAFAARRALLHALGDHSRERLHALMRELPQEVDCSGGILVMLRTAREREHAQAGLQVLQEAGLRCEVLEPDAARSVEPALAPGAAFAGAVHLPDDGVASCRQFAVLLKQRAAALGARFAFDTTVLPLDRDQLTRLRLRGPDGEVQDARFDTVVVSAGTGLPALLRPAGLRLPLAAVRGASLTAPIAEPLNAPRSAVVDPRLGVSLARLGERVRVAGGAVLGSRAARHDEEVLRRLYRALHDWFPAGVRLTGCGVAPQHWRGERLRLPDGLPVLGPSRLPGVWLNAGHGPAAWTLACGSARLLADLLAGREPAPGLDAQALSPSRLGA